MLSFVGFCKRIKMKKIYIKKKTLPFNAYKYKFLLCNKLSESHGEVVHLVSFFMLLYGIYNIKR